VPVGVLAQVERDEVEPEHLGLDLQVAHPAVGDRVPRRLTQAVAQQLQVGDELLGAWRRRAGDAVVGAPRAAGALLGHVSSTLVDEREELAVWLLRVAVDELGGLVGQPLAQLLEPCRELVADVPRRSLTDRWAWSRSIDRRSSRMASCWCSRSVCSVTSTVTLGLPSRSPPIHDPNRRNEVRSTGCREGIGDRLAQLAVESRGTRS
jgi:hypothetical protein